MAVWKNKRMDYDASGNLIYRGLAPDLNTKTGEDKWYIWKYIWTGNDLEKILGPAHGSWDNRASLEWL